MRKFTTIPTAMFAGAAALSLAACGGSETTTTTDEDTAVTDVDPGESDGTIDDTTVIDGTIGADDNMAEGMPEDGAEPAADGEDAAEGDAEADAGEGEAETE